jgi:hypothetical protein
MSSPRRGAGLLRPISARSLHVLSPLSALHHARKRKLSSRPERPVFFCARFSSAGPRSRGVPARLIWKAPVYLQLRLANLQRHKLRPNKRFHSLRPGNHQRRVLALRFNLQLEKRTTPLLLSHPLFQLQQSASERQPKCISIPQFHYIHHGLLQLHAQRFVTRPLSGRHRSHSASKSQAFAHVISQLPNASNARRNPRSRAAFPPDHN